MSTTHGVKRHDFNVFRSLPITYYTPAKGVKEHMHNFTSSMVDFGGRVYCKLQSINSNEAKYIGSGESESNPLSTLVKVILYPISKILQIAFRIFVMNKAMIYKEKVNAPQKPQAELPPLIQAIRSKDLEKVKALAASAKDLNTPWDERSPLAQAVGNFPLVQALVEAGATIDDQAFAFAVRKGDEKSVRLFIEKKANIHATYQDGFHERTLLMTSTLYGHTKVTRLLIDAGVNLEQTIGEEEDTVLSFLVKSCGRTIYEERAKAYLEGIQTLVEAGADVNTLHKTYPYDDIRLWQFWKVLTYHQEGRGGLIPSLEFLLKNGLEINRVSPTEEKNTALHEAVLKRNLELVELFMRYEADPSIKDKDGKTPLDLANDLKGEKGAAIRAALTKKV